MSHLTTERLPQPSPDALSSHSAEPPLDDCWNRVGVKGDRSCPELPKVGHCHNCPVFSAAGERLFARPLPDECIAKRAREFDQPEGRGIGASLAVLVFRVGDEWLALDVRKMVEVAESRVIQRVPHHRGKVLRGLVNIRGELQLCVALAEVLGITTTGPTEAQSGWLLVAEHEQLRWALAVDQVAGVQRVARDQLTAVPATVAQGKQPYSQGVFLDGDRRVGLVDADRLFGTLQKTSW